MEATFTASVLPGNSKSEFAETVLLWVTRTDGAAVSADFAIATASRFRPTRGQTPAKISRTNSSAAPASPIRRRAFVFSLVDWEGVIADVMKWFPRSSRAANAAH